MKVARGLVLLLMLGLSGGCFQQIQQEADKKFGDQSLKTSVALIELHKLRYGLYPEKLSDLKFIGNWDPNALKSVSYTVAKDRKSYYLEVTRGWVGKPTLKMPPEFWQGTGYNPLLKPKN